MDGLKNRTSEICFRHGWNFAYDWVLAFIFPLLSWCLSTFVCSSSSSLFRLTLHTVSEWVLLFVQLFSAFNTHTSAITVCVCVCVRCLYTECASKSEWCWRVYMHRVSAAAYVCVYVYCFAFFLSEKHVKPSDACKIVLRKKETPHTRTPASNATHAKRFHTQRNIAQTHKPVSCSPPFFDRWRGKYAFVFSTKLTDEWMIQMEYIAFYSILLWLSHAAWIKCILIEMTMSKGEENASAINLHVQHLFIFFSFILTFIFVRICSSTTHI